MWIRRNRLIQERRSGGFICLIVMLVLGCFSITTTSLLARSDKRTEIEDALTITGDYDEIIYNTGIGFEESLLSQDYVDEIGLYYELGMVSNNTEIGSFKAVALKDDLSEEIYHLTCIRGRYPRQENEIAIDVSVANTFGIAPYPGETIDLKLFNANGDYIETRSLEISGVFRCSDNEVVGGWYRCPSFAFENDAYQMPAVFFPPTYCDVFACENETVFFRSSSLDGGAINREVANLLRETGQKCIGFDNNSRRGDGYSWYVGLGHSLSGFFTWDIMNEAVNNGLYKRDFYSEFLIPIMSLLVIVTEAVSIFMLSRNIIANRKEHYAIFRSLGVTAKQIVYNLLIDILGAGLVSAIAGITLGYVGHIFLINALNKLLHLRLYDGIHVDHIVSRITYDPIMMSLSVCACALVLALIIPVYRLYKMYPAELLSTTDSVFVGEKRNNASQTSNLRSGWLGLLNRRVDLHDWSTMLVLTIVLSSLLLGYVFFRAFSEQATVEPRGYMEMLDIDGIGYVVTKSSGLRDWGYNVSNRHDAGIIASFPELVESNPDVKDSWAVIFNESTRMVFDEIPDSNTQLLLGHRLLNYRASNDPFVEDSLIAEGIVFEHMGYDPDVYMYELPTVGLTTNELIGLEGEVVSGEINLDRISSGEEIVLAVPEELQYLCLQYYPVGTILDFDDVVLSDEEDNLNFNTLDDPQWVVYDNYIETESGDVYVSYGSFGARYGIETRVGAIVVLHETHDISEYLTRGTNWVNQLHYTATSDSIDPEPGYGMSVLCLPDTFYNWGLPDRMFTSVKVELNDDCNIYQFDRFWYEALSGSVEVQTRSTFDYIDDISIGVNRVMTIFFALIIVLVFLGTISIITGMYTKTRSNIGRFQTLRRIGLSVKQASLMIYTQNMFYPVIASLAALIPVYFIQFVLKIYLRKLENGEINITETPWGIRLPLIADLFSYDFIPVLICCFVLGYLLIFIGTLPQILYLRKMKMIETRED